MAPDVTIKNISNASFLSGHLDHTFALSSAHSRFRVGSTRNSGRWRVGAGVIFRSVRCVLIRLLTGRLPAKWLGTAARYGSVFSQVRP